MRILFGILVCILSAGSAVAQQLEYPGDFRARSIDTNGTSIYVRTAGKGPAVMLLHGYGETGDMWVPLAVELARDHTVVIPDLRGMGLSAKPPGGYDKKSQAEDMAGVLDTLKIPRADVVAHDIGNMVAFALAARYPNRVTRLVVIDAPVPGIGPWEEVLKNPLLWHFRFGGPDMERLVAGRERIYLDRFWNEFSATPARFSEAARVHYAKLYAQPGAMRSGFAQFAAFDQDAIDNRAFLAANGPLRMPVLAVGGEKSFGPLMATIMRFAATDVTQQVVPESGHWIMDENPTATTRIVQDFLRSPVRQLRLAPAEVAALNKGGAGAGTSGVAGIRSTVLQGDPEKPGQYTIEIRVPPNTRIQSHTHRDERSAVVVSGTWYFGYGPAADEKVVKSLAPGSFYTEPANVAHFALTRDEPAVVYITGWGPTDTEYVDAKADPRRN